ncbi:MAG: hypothetical protein ACRC4W_05240 [Treponemataceae bacterium]
MYTRLYWVKFFKDKAIGSLTRLDIENFITYLTEKKSIIISKKSYYKGWNGCLEMGISKRID